MKCRQKSWTRTTFVQTKRLNVKTKETEEQRKVLVSRLEIKEEHPKRIKEHSFRQIVKISRNINNIYLLYILYVSSPSL